MPNATTPRLHADTPIQYLKGVGPARAKLFEKLGIATLGGLLCHYPRRYIDYTAPYPVATAPYDLACVVKAEVFAKHPKRRINGGRSMERVSAGDETASLELTWFNNPYATQKLECGTEYYLEGTLSGSPDRRQMINPTVRTAAQVAKTPLVAIYPQTEGLSSGIIAKCVAQLLEHAGELPDALPAAMREKYQLPTKAEAVRMVHQPASEDEVFKARRRLIYEELFILQLGMGLLKHRDANQTGAPMRPFALEPFWRSLPFAPTGAQQRAAGEILADMTGEDAMNRLLQGDVGAGKTLVAAAAIYTAHQNGYQSALLAPTEILATQHAGSLADTLAPFGIRVALYTGGLRAAEKRAVLSAVAAGEVDLLVGTHAMLNEAVQPPRLGLAIVDEQHRFGVRQRGLLAQKGAAPHLLIMSATPIPRTLGLLLYGDLDISILDELPPGRVPIKTRYMTGKRRADLFGFLEAQLAAGHQAYIVCPAIEGAGEGDGASDINAAKTYYTETACPLLPKRVIGLMHGKLKPKEKAAVMADFKAGLIDVLVSTTVIEVGVDVPNATVMVIENAERYGLSALHQLRGRVGRGGGESWCFLVSDHASEKVQTRLKFLSGTTDGFAIAQYDLETRGPGDFFGNRQHGLPALQIADLMQDTRTLHAAQSEAAALLAADATLSQPEHAALAAQVGRMFAEAGVLN